MTYIGEDLDFFQSAVFLITNMMGLPTFASIAVKHGLAYYYVYPTLYCTIVISWRSIASDEDVSESYGVSAAQSWTRKCDHTGGMQQQPLGQVFFLCGPGAYDRDPANVSF